MIPSLDSALLLLISIVSNAFSALAGGGAGLIQLPTLILFGLPFPSALATHKLASVALGIGASIRHIKEGNINLLTCLYILLSGVPGVVLGSKLVLVVPNEVSTLLLGLLTLGLGLYSIKEMNINNNKKVHKFDLKNILIGSFVLFTIGIINGSISSGSGLFVTALLVKWFGMSYKKAVAYTLIIVGLFWNGSGALVLTQEGNIEWQWLPVLILGSISGGYIGAHLSIVKSNIFTKRSFEALTIIMGFSLLIKCL